MILPTCVCVGNQVNVEAYLIAWRVSPANFSCKKYEFSELRLNAVLGSPHGPALGEMGLRWSCQGYSGSLLAPEVYGTVRGATPLFHLATCGIFQSHELLHGTR